MTPEELLAALRPFPRLHLNYTPTPLQPMPRLSASLGGPPLWLKRDDELGPGGGGNKGRPLEFLLGEAVAQGSRKIVTFGRLQSNHVRMTAAACARLGLQTHLFFFEKRPSTLQGNLLLDQLFGAKLHFIPFGGGGDASMTLETTNRLVRLVSWLLVGPGAYFMPVGGHTAVGCLGYVAAAVEIQAQIAALELDPARVTIVLPVGTGVTLAGLWAGFHLLGSPVRVLGIDVGKLWHTFPASIARLATGVCSLLGQPRHFTAGEVPIIEKTYVGEGYSRLRAEAVAAIKLMAQVEGVVLDPVYSGKAFAGLLDLLGNGRFAPDAQIVFLHTGGLPGLWPYADRMV
ncbi:MAG: D-cysteine desulfhydrase family protein [Anaerolineaceae bacterium]|nr:D-cysteine desulfhydrase family protein [Anaerolineaceae bacterium]